MRSYHISLRVHLLIGFITLPTPPSLPLSLPSLCVCVCVSHVCVQVQIDVTLNCINLLLGDLALIALRVQVGACGVAEAKRSFRSRAFLPILPPAVV
jgi:hypothetical protein